MRVKPSSSAQRRKALELDRWLDRMLPLASRLVRHRLLADETGLGERKEQRTYATTTQTPASVAEMLHRQKVTPPEVSWPDPRAHGRRNPVVSSLPLYPHLSGFGSIPRADNHSNTTYNLHHGGFQSTASPVLRSPDLDCNQAYNFGYESTYPQPMNAILPNTASSLDVAPEFISHYPEIQASHRATIA